MLKPAIGISAKNLKDIAGMLSAVWSDAVDLKYFQPAENISLTFIS